MALIPEFQEYLGKRSPDAQRIVGQTANKMSEQQQREFLASLQFGDAEFQTEIAPYMPEGSTIDPSRARFKRFPKEAGVGPAGVTLLGIETGKITDPDHPELKIDFRGHQIQLEPQTVTAIENAPARVFAHEYRHLEDSDGPEMVNRIQDLIASQNLDDLKTGIQDLALSFRRKAGVGNRKLGALYTDIYNATIDSDKEEVFEAARELMQSPAVTRLTRRYRPVMEKAAVGNYFEQNVLAKGMNEGGMMQNPVMQRPMFQTPMQRKGMGIMAGVAPIQGYANGGDAEVDDLGDIASDAFRLLVVDVNDPVDVAISSAAATMAATGIGGPAALLTKLVGTGRKLYKGADAAAKATAKAEEKVRKLEEAGLFRQTASKAGEKAMSYLGEKEALGFLTDPVGYTQEIGEIFEEEPPETSGGIGSLPVANMASGGDVPRGKLAGILSLITNFLKKDAKKDKKEDKKEEVKADDEPILEDRSALRRGVDVIRRNPIKTGLAGLGGTGALVYNYGGDLLSENAGTASTEIDADDANGEAPPEAPSMVPVDRKVQGPMFGPPMPAKGITKFLLGEDAKFGGDKGAIDFLRGEPADFLSRAIGKLQDPRLQYQLARAAQPSEGPVPRNYFSDLTLAGQEYDDALAQREYIEAQTEAQQTSDIEKLATFYASNTPGFDQVSEEAQKAAIQEIALTLFKDENAQKEAAVLLEVLKLVGTGEDAKDIVNKFTSIETQVGDTLGDIEKRFKAMAGQRQ